MAFRRNTGPESEYEVRCRALEKAVSLFEKELKERPENTKATRCLRYSDEVFFIFHKAGNGAIEAVFHNKGTKTRCSTERALNQAKTLVRQMIEGI